MKERDLFIAALQITDPAERCAWLDGACGGDTALRQRLAVLLKALDQAGSLLENPLVAPGDIAESAGLNEAASQFSPSIGAATESSPDCPGTVIGPYKLLQ